MYKAAILCGAVGAAGLTLYTGRRNPSVLLMAIFTIWVLSPFVALAWADVAAKRRPVLAKALHWVTPVVALGTLVIYAYVAFGPPRSKPAAAFLLVPALSWVLMVTVTVWARSNRQ